MTYDLSILWDSLPVKSVKYKIYIFVNIFPEAAHMLIPEVEPKLQPKTKYCEKLNIVHGPVIILKIFPDNLTNIDTDLKKNIFLG